MDRTAWEDDCEPYPQLWAHAARRQAPPIVSKRLGHLDPSVTKSIYADVIPDDDISAVDVFSKAVWGA